MAEVYAQQNLIQVLSGIPEHKKTTGDFTRLKRLHNLYRQLKIDSDSLVTVIHYDATGNEVKAYQFLTISSHAWFILYI